MTKKVLALGPHLRIVGSASPANPMNKPNPSHPTSEQLAALDQPLRNLVDAHTAVTEAEKKGEDTASLEATRESLLTEVLAACKAIGFTPSSGVLASVVATASSLGKSAGKGERTPYALCATGKFLHDCHLFSEARRFR